MSAANIYATYCPCADTLWYLYSVVACYLGFPFVISPVTSNGIDRSNNNIDTQCDRYCNHVLPLSAYILCLSYLHNLVEEAVCLVCVYQVLLVCL